ncbi:hypothetical protein ERJ75_001329300 [Trypanosoma vivax]|nr:hypothetical protein TRVL_02429 [Trypanosoma vivax]KAH8607910.1 hypothetical protein ERJ75_001329300 [Trypanosoma vivax]
MSSRTTELVSAASLLRDELRLLNGAIEGQMRSRVYRHHLFFRDAVVLRAALRKFLPQLSGGRRTVEGHTVASRRLLSLAIRCAESATLELSASRVDTFAIATLFLAAASRIGCVLCAVSNHNPDIFGRMSMSDGKFCVTQSAQQRKRAREEVDADPFEPLVEHTIGSVLEAAAKQVGGTRR